MASEPALKAWNAYMACQCQGFEKSKDQQDRNLPKPFVTISRQTGAGGITIGQKLAEYLQERDRQALCPWTLFDRDLIQAVLEEHNFPQDYAKFMSEDKTSEIQDSIEELFGLHPSKWTLVHKTSETILHLAQMGNAIIVGRGANVVTRRFLNSGVHVRLIGSLKKRIKHIQEYYQLSSDEAAQFIRTEDEGRRRYLSQNFDKNIDDPLLYDLVVNTDFVSYGEAAKLIGEAALDLSRQLASQVGKN